MSKCPIGHECVIGSHVHLGNNIRVGTAHGIVSCAPDCHVVICYHCKCLVLAMTMSFHLAAFETASLKVSSLPAISNARLYISVFQLALGRPLLRFAHICKRSVPGSNIVARSCDDEGNLASLPKYANCLLSNVVLKGIASHRCLTVRFDTLL